MGEAGDFEVTTRREDGRLVVAPRGELDIASVDRLRAAIGQRAPGEDLVVDLRELGFLDTSGLQLVIELHRRSREEGFSFTVVRGSRDVNRVFEIAGLDQALPFTDGDGTA